MGYDNTRYVTRSEAISLIEKHLNDLNDEAIIEILDAIAQATFAPFANFVINDNVDK